MSTYNTNIQMERKIAFICGDISVTIAYLKASGFAIETAEKIILAILVGFVGGVAGLFGKDFYTKKIRNKVFK